MSELQNKRRFHIETVQENPGTYTWRIVNRDVDTGQLVGAPVTSVALYETEAAAQAAASETLRKLVAGSFVSSSLGTRG
ncbi:MAG: hypothetical protein EOO27_11035 [Comamonadaceae bacterium]|nr:MAG: hypothetical protein EOO27_11035 [Comamonadaceae bacterium]